VLHESNATPGRSGPEIPLADGLYTWPSDNPKLIASRCKACGEVAFPAQQGCACCTADDAEEILLSQRGTLWTWTVQHFPPPHPYMGDPKAFEPFGVGYIELPEGVRVESRLTVSDPDALEIGMEMELAIEKFAENDAGQALMTFVFRPVANGFRPVANG
jgi:uncharacterized OB-fold protein